MEIDILQEAGYEMALYGLSLSFKDRAVPTFSWWTPDRYERMKKLVVSLASRDGGHNKFLRQIMLWIDIEAPRYWWSEFDTYKVGTVAQSESTMHTLGKRPPNDDDFEGGFGCTIDQDTLTYWKEYSVVEVKRLLPEAYLQRRLVTMNYEVLNNILKQREGHRLPEWEYFIKAVREQVKHKELIHV